MSLDLYRDAASLLLGPESMTRNLAGLTMFGNWESTGNVIESPVITVPPRDIIVILGRAVMAAADHIELRQGWDPGQINTGLTCWTRNVISRGMDTGAFGNSDAGIFYGSSTRSEAGWPLQFTGNALVSDNGGTTVRAFMVTIQNRAGYPKTADWMMSRSTGVAATIGPVMSGFGEQCSSVATAGQLITFALRARSGGANLAAETGFGIFGADY